MKLFAVSDLHLGHPQNRALLETVRQHTDDWLILAGDVGDSVEDLTFAIELLAPKFRQLVWVPGNHELWTRSNGRNETRGVAKYHELVSLCRRYGVITPEDEYPIAKFGDRTFRIVPLFLLYDYSFRPKDVLLDEAIAWAQESGVGCLDETFLSPYPYRSRGDWCNARCDETFGRLSIVPVMPTVLINHFPLSERLAVLPRIPRFSLWCGTRRTQSWHRMFGTEIVIYGHLHIRGTRFADGVRFEEVSLGYPREWFGRITADGLLRQILPLP